MHITRWSKTYVFHKKEILIQPPGEPREQHLGDVQHKKYELQKISSRRNDWKGIYIYLRIFEANFIWLLDSKISRLETLKLLEVLVLL